MVRKKWSKEDEVLISSLFKSGKTYKEIALILDRTEISVSSKIKKLNLIISPIWTKEEIEKAVCLFESGMNFLQISKELNKTQNSVTKKLNRLGYKYWESNLSCNWVNKQEKLYTHRTLKREIIDWDKVQDFYTNSNYRGLQKEFSLTPKDIKWAQDNGKLKLRTLTEAVQKAIKEGRKNISSKEGIERYRQLCEFKFSVKNYPEEFDLKLIQEHGWYKAANRGNNLGGVSRDHIISVKFGFENGISPEIISHPANCRLMRHADNQVKNSYSGMSIEELEEKIRVWDKKYSQKLSF